MIIIHRGEFKTLVVVKENTRRGSDSRGFSCALLSPARRRSAGQDHDWTMEPPGPTLSTSSSHLELITVTLVQAAFNLQHLPSSFSSLKLLQSFIISVIIGMCVICHLFMLKNVSFVLFLNGLECPAPAFTHSGCLYCGFGYKIELLRLNRSLA